MLFIGKMDNNMETTIVYMRFIGVMEKKMETTNWGLGFIEFRGNGAWEHFPQNSERWRASTDLVDAV